MTAITSRRAVLAGVAAASTLSILALAAEPDPIFSKIDQHRSAWAGLIRYCDEMAKLERALPRERRAWHSDIRERTPSQDCQDAPEWIANELAGRAAHDAVDLAAIALVSTVPTTAAGLTALVDYIRTHDESTGDNILDDEVFTTEFTKGGRAIYCDMAATFAETVKEFALRLDGRAA